jgi:hypothetical protein
MKKNEKTSEKVLISFQKTPGDTFYKKYYSGDTTLGVLKTLEFGRIKKPVLNISDLKAQYFKSMIYNRNELDMLFEINITSQKPEDEIKPIFSEFAFKVDNLLEEKSCEIMNIFSSEELCIGWDRKFQPKSAKFCLGWVLCLDGGFFTIEDKRDKTLQYSLKLIEITRRISEMSKVIYDIFLSLKPEFGKDIKYTTNPNFSNIKSLLPDNNLERLKN